MNELLKIPYLGIGMGLRTEITDETFAHEADIDVVEIISEGFFSYKPKVRHDYLDRALEHFKVIPHGIGLSIGSVVEQDIAFLDEIKTLCNKINAPYYSDHFCLSRNDSLSDIGHLSPLWYTKETLSHLVSRIDTVQQYVGLPLILENITAPFIIPNADYEEPEFITKVCEQSGCGLLLDITNVFINAHNTNIDPLTLLKRYPMKHVVHIHLAGGTIDKHGKYHDTHSSGVHKGVWPLLEHVVTHANPKTYIIERDQDFDTNFNNLVLEDLKMIRSIVEKD